MLAPTHYLDLVAGSFFGTTPEQLQALFTAVETSPNGQNLVVHFHGGLVSRAAAMRSAEEVLLPVYRAAGAYPIFFVWNSDVITTLTSDLEAVVQEKAFQRLLKRLARYVIGAVYGGEPGRSAASLEMPSPQDVPEDPAELADYLRQEEQKRPPRPRQPTEEQLRQMEKDPESIPDVILSPAQQQQIRNDLKKDDDLRRALQELGGDQQDPAAAGRSGGAQARLAEGMLQEQMAEATSTGDRAVLSIPTGLLVKGVKIVARVTARFLRGRDHGLYDTLLQEALRELLWAGDLGGTVWGVMKGHTKTAFNSGANYGGTAFLRQLKAAWRPGMRVTLVGHSTGAIFIGHFLDAVEAQQFPDAAQFDVVFLAPACTFAFLDVRLKVFQKRVRQLRLFGLKDERERSYWEVPFLSRGSLLYIVAGLFEDEVDMPLLGMQRYHSGAAPYDGEGLKPVGAYVKASRPVWAVADEEDGRRSAALTHGGMTEEPKTLRSLAHLLKGGW
jgi:hypothetical protein